MRPTDMTAGDAPVEISDEQAAAAARAMFDEPAQLHGEVIAGGAGLGCDGYYERLALARHHEQVIETWLLAVAILGALATAVGAALGWL